MRVQPPKGTIMNVNGSLCSDVGFGVGGANVDDQKRRDWMSGRRGIQTKPKDLR